MESIWIDGVKRPTFDSLREDINCDVLVIGGGMAGILCAYMLSRDGADVVIAEADRICSGVTENTTAKVTLQHGLMYDKAVSRFGIGMAHLYLAAQYEALCKYKELCREFDCNFEPRSSYVYSLDNRSAIENEVSALRRIGCKATFVERTDLPFPIAGAVRVGGQAQFHPLKFAYKIAQDLKIYEHTRVTELRDNVAVTTGGKISANKIIVATHFPFINKHGSYFLKMYQSRSYVIALRGAADVHGMYVDMDDKGLSFRNYGDLLLIGGGGHRTGKQGGNWRELREFAKAHYPNAQEIGYWATQDCMTLDGIPYIGQYSRHTPSLYVATGFNKWGMTSSMVAASLLTDLIEGRQSKYAGVFSPSRTIMRPQLAVNAAETVISILTPTTPRCPHLGCALKYNRQEHSWDCPCHGSRFGIDGKLLDNPSTKGIKLK